MKYLKKFEFANKQFREVDLQKLLDMYFVFDKNGNWNNICDKFKKVLEPMLLDKEVKFLRMIHPIDGEPIYSEFGRVKSIRLKIKNNSMDLILNLYDDKDEYSIDLEILGIDDNKPQFVKIYNSEKTDLEYQIELANNIDKFNV